MKKQRIHTGKKVLGAILVFCILGLIAGMVGWFMGLEGADRVMGVFAGMATLVISGYYLKSGKENVKKIELNPSYFESEG